MSRSQTENTALARLQTAKSSYQTLVKLNYEHAAKDCTSCPTRGVCCTDEHFVNVHITRLEAVAIRKTLMGTPRLTDDQRREVFERARAAVRKFRLASTGDTFAQTYSCPLYDPSAGCLVHRRAKPSPCIQHACYEVWQDLPPPSLQTRMEHRVEQLNTDVYGSEWRWLPIPVWLMLVDPESDGKELERLEASWRTRKAKPGESGPNRGRGVRKRAHLPVISRSS